MAAPVSKDQEVELDVESLAYGGNGVARLNGYVVFVRRGLPGDRVRARVTKVKRNHAEALALEVVAPGPQRVDAPCAHYPACGGCRFQDLAYESQLVQKHSWVEDSLRSESTRLNSSHTVISYAVFCLKKKKKEKKRYYHREQYNTEDVV